MKPDIGTCLRNYLELPKGRNSTYYVYIELYFEESYHVGSYWNG